MKFTVKSEDLSTGRISEHVLSPEAQQQLRERLIGAGVYLGPIPQQRDFKAASDYEQRKMSSLVGKVESVVSDELTIEIDEMCREKVLVLLSTPSSQLQSKLDCLGVLGSAFGSVISIKSVSGVHLVGEADESS